MIRLDPLNPTDPVEITPKEFELQVRDWLARGSERLDEFHLTHQGRVSGQGGEYAIDVLVRLMLGGASFSRSANIKGAL